MKRIALAALAALVLAVLYLLSPFSNSAQNLSTSLERIQVAPAAIGYRAIIVNDGYLPVWVGRCETISDAMERDVRVGDALQRWGAESGKWETVVDRSGCKQVPTGLIEAKYTRRLLWPRQSLHTISFFPNVGFANSPFESGDRVRFAVFTHKPQPLSSPEFIVE